MEHTPGPWKSDFRNIYIDGISIAVVTDHKNVPIITNAPEMYEVLCDFCYTRGNTRTVRDKMITVLRKIEGR